jgi:hypothetical protein
MSASSSRLSQISPRNGIYHVRLVRNFCDCLLSFLGRMCSRPNNYSESDNSKHSEEIKTGPSPIAAPNAKLESVSKLVLFRQSFYRR